MNKVSVQSLNECFNVSGPKFIWIEEIDNADKVNLPWNAGRNHTEETKKLISEALKGKKWTKQKEEKMRQFMKGNQYRKGKTTSSEVKAKLREALITNWKITFDDGRIIQNKFSIREFCENYGYDRKSIYNIMKGKMRKHKDIVAVEKLAQAPSQQT